MRLCLDVRSDRPIAMPQYLRRPRRRHVLPSGSLNRPTDNSINHRLGQRDVKPHQVISKKLPFPFVEPTADFSFWNVSNPPLYLPTVPQFFNELQRILQGFPANGASRSLVTQLYYIFYGPTNDGYSATKPSFWHWGRRNSGLYRAPFSATSLVKLRQYSVTSQKVVSLLRAGSRSRRLTQGYLDQRTATEDRCEGVTGADGEGRRYCRARSRLLMTLFGEVTIRRLGYSGARLKSVSPLDAAQGGFGSRARWKMR
jgi:hypothetical protein